MPGESVTRVVAYRREDWVGLGKRMRGDREGPAVEIGVVLWTYRALYACANLTDVSAAPKDCLSFGIVRADIGVRDIVLNHQDHSHFTVLQTKRQKWGNDDVRYVIHFNVAILWHEPGKYSSRIPRLCTLSVQTPVLL